MKNTNRVNKSSIWDKGDGDQFLQNQLEAMDLRDNIPPQLFAVISSVLEAIELMDEGDSHESKSSSV